MNEKTYKPARQITVIHWLKHDDAPHVRRPARYDWTHFADAAWLVNIPDPLPNGWMEREIGRLMTVFKCRLCGHPAQDHGLVDTEAGTMAVCPGDYLEPLNLPGFYGVRRAADFKI